MPDADIARGALVDAERVHAAAGVDDGLSLVELVRCHRHLDFISIFWRWTFVRSGVRQSNMAAQEKADRIVRSFASGPDRPLNLTQNQPINRLSQIYFRAAWTVAIPLITNCTE